MSTIHFEAQLITIGSWTIVRLPLAASTQLPSRGMTMVKGTINDVSFQAPLEPDGKGSHWFKVEEHLREATKTNVGDTVSLVIESTKDWPEPKVPADLKQALANDPRAQSLWQQITPMARWDWIRWIRATKNPATRQHRIEVACSKLSANNRRPCCFNRTVCTEPSVSNNGVLTEPVQAVSN